MAGKRKIPPSEWTVERPYDSADYLDRPIPGKMGPERSAAFLKKQREKILRKGPVRRDPDGSPS